MSHAEFAKVMGNDFPTSSAADPVERQLKNGEVSDKAIGAFERRRSSNPKST